MSNGPSFGKGSFWWKDACLNERVYQDIRNIDIRFKMINWKKFVKILGYFYFFKFSKFQYNDIILNIKFLTFFFTIQPSIHWLWMFNKEQILINYVSFFSPNKISLATLLNLFARVHKRATQTYVRIFHV